MMMFETSKHVPKTEVLLLIFTTLVLSRPFEKEINIIPMEMIIFNI